MIGGCTHGENYCPPPRRRPHHHYHLRPPLHHPHPLRKRQLTPTSLLLLPLLLLPMLLPMLLLLPLKMKVLVAIPMVPVVVVVVVLVVVPVPVVVPPLALSLLRNGTPPSPTSPHPLLSPLSWPKRSVSSTWGWWGESGLHHNAATGSRIKAMYRYTTTLTYQSQPYHYPFLSYPTKTLMHLTT